MKPVILAVSLLATNAMALDFDSEWSKFDADFARLKSFKVAKVEPKYDLPSVSRDNVLEQVDPKSPDRLGYKLSDPAMRDKVTGLYKKPDTVVYSLTLTE